MRRQAANEVMRDTSKRLPRVTTNPSGSGPDRSRANSIPTSSPEASRPRMSGG